MAEIWVHVEEDEGKVAPITLEILTKARTLGVDVVAVALGSAANQVDQLGEYGATKVLADARGDYSEYFSLPAVEAFVSLAQERKPLAIIFGGSYDGRDIGHLHRRERRALASEIQVVFQDPYSSLNPAMTIAQILAEPLTVRGVATKTARERVRALLEQVHLPSNSMDRLPRVFDSLRS